MLSERDKTMIIYARKYLDDMKHLTDIKEQKEEIQDCMDWLKELHDTL